MREYRASVLLFVCKLKLHTGQHKWHLSAAAVDPANVTHSVSYELDHMLAVREHLLLLLLVGHAVLCCVDLLNLPPALGLQQQYDRQRGQPAAGRAMVAAKVGRCHSQPHSRVELHMKGWTTLHRVSPIQTFTDWWPWPS